MKPDNFYPFEYSNYCLHLHCYIYNILAETPFSLLQTWEPTQNFELDLLFNPWG